ncbi:hypothetical protein BJ980_000943 [Nocardioides daedukensis]|uniref:DUF308 domain-containing protein n=1 Tax=Nocardioides daedukensis TaxID=634462 RepID=A0A7Y9UVM8_9ACTN|nr:hypothetical protein [Nocardioides daedukensis]NYG58020.1 hypothetical protein [Nocardioides daedukensis]
MEPRNEDELWKEIVEHYSDPPTIEADEPVAAPPDRDDEPATAYDALPQQEAPDPFQDPDPLGALWREEERFVPPTPPPLPMPEPARMLAWIALFGAPVLMLVALVAGRPFTGIWGVLLAAAFVGGFVYLVKTMSSEPRDPGDNGARL